MSTFIPPRISPRQGFVLPKSPWMNSFMYVPACVFSLIVKTSEANVMNVRQLYPSCYCKLICKKRNKILLLSS